MNAAQIQLAAFSMLAILIVLFVTPDVFPALHTYGFSIGTNTHYLSASLVNWHPYLTWENAS